MIDLDELEKQAHSTDPFVRATTISALCAEIERLRGLANDCQTTLRTCRVFITSREKMHPHGVELWDELLKRCGENK